MKFPGRVSLSPSFNFVNFVTVSLMIDQRCSRTFAQSRSRTFASEGHSVSSPYSRIWNFSKFSSRNFLPEIFYSWFSSQKLAEFIKIQQNSSKFLNFLSKRKFQWWIYDIEGSLHVEIDLELHEKIARYARQL